MISCLPIKYEITDENGMKVGNVETFDEGAAIVSLNWACNASSWAEVSLAVYKALVGCELTESGKGENHD